MDVDDRLRIAQEKYDRVLRAQDKVKELENKGVTTQEEKEALELANDELFKAIDEYSHEFFSVIGKADENVRDGFTDFVNNFYDGSTDKYLEAIKEEMTTSFIFKRLEHEKEFLDNSNELVKCLMQPLHWMTRTLDTIINDILKEARNYVKFLIEHQEPIISPILEDIARASTVSDKWKVKYHMMRQNALTNNFNRVVKLSEKNSIVDYDEKNEICIFNQIQNIPNFIIAISNLHEKEVEIKTCVKKLLDMMMIEFTSDVQEPFIMFSVKNYASTCGIRNVTDAKKQIKEALEILSNIFILYGYKKTDDKKDEEFFIKEKNFIQLLKRVFPRYRENANYAKAYLNKYKIIDNWVITDSNVIVVRFTDEFAAILREEAYVMPYPLSILSAQKNVYYIAHKMAELKNMNLGEVRENVLSVKNILRSCPYPYPKSPQKLAEALEDDLQKVCELLNIPSHGFEFTYARGKRIPNEKLLEMTDIIDMYVHFDEWKDYPRDWSKRKERLI